LLNTVSWQELVLIPGLILLGILAGIIPALSAYRTDVSKNLSA
jgi:putative ABC transport system permease protein